MQILRGKKYKNCLNSFEEYLFFFVVTSSTIPGYKYWQLSVVSASQNILKIKRRFLFLLLLLFILLLFILLLLILLLFYCCFGYCFISIVVIIITGSHYYIEKYNPVCLKSYCVLELNSLSISS